MTPDGEIPGFPGLRGEFQEYLVGSEYCDLSSLRRCPLCEWFSATEGRETTGVCHRLPEWIVVLRTHWCGEFLADPALLHDLIQQEEAVRS
jgi:hypothetical protein